MQDPGTGAYLQYDAAGDLTNDGYQSFSYDTTGQQTTASYSGYALTQNYDGNGLRVKKSESGTTTYYLRSSVLGGQVICELDVNGSWARGYVYLGGQMLAIQSSGVSWTFQDPVTKSQRVTNGSGNVTSVIDLDPWGGETWRSSNAAFQPHRYTSYERDANGGDDAMMRRHHTYWNRFDQPDPYDGSYDLGDPQSFNRYSYTQSDPVNFVDPTGLMPCIEMIDPATGQMMCVGGGTVGIVTVHGGPLSPIDDPTTYSFIINSINFRGLIGGGGGGGAGGGGGQDPYDVRKIVKDTRDRMRQKERNDQAWREYQDCIEKNPMVITARQDFGREWNRIYFESWDVEGRLLEAGGEISFETYKHYRKYRAVRLATKANVFSLVTTFIVGALVSGVPSSVYNDLHRKLESQMKPIQDACMKQITSKYGFAPTSTAR